MNESQTGRSTHLWGSDALLREGFHLWSPKFRNIWPANKMVRKRLFRCFSAPEEPRRRSGECDGARFVVMVRESCQAGTIGRQRLQVSTQRQLTSQPLQMRPSPTPPRVLQRQALLFSYAPSLRYPYSPSHGA